MKKHSALLRASGILLVLTLGTSCLVGGTFAKYVTRGSGDDSARVAKWGVEVEVTGGGFGTTYGKEDANATTIGPSVQGDGSETIPFTWNSNGESKSQKEEVSNVLAPGTKGTFGGVKITGQPEVAVKVETTANVVLTGWNVDDGGEFYCPLVFTIGNKTINGLDYSSRNAGGADSFESAIKKAIEDATTKELEAGTDLNTVGDDITYSWEWPFENAKGTAANQDNELDTLLGNNALGEGVAEIPAVLITVTTTVTQID